MEVEEMFIEIIKGQTATNTEMRVRNELDRAKCEMGERREIRNARFTWFVLVLCAATLGVKGVEFLASANVI